MASILEADGFGRPPDWLFGHGRLEQQAAVNDSANEQRPLNPDARPFLPSGVARLLERSRSRDHADNDNSAESLRERLCRELEHESYECMICCGAIRRNHGLWSCANCYQAFHYHRRYDLSCITKWAQRKEGDEAGWRCPGCQNVNAEPPAEYRCFCAKNVNPRPPRGEAPHSCGEVCGRSRGVGCPHKCILLCHPGPCPACPRTVAKKCQCGATEKLIRCGTAQTIKCNTSCGRMLNCGIHRCDVVCHSGACPTCSQVVAQTCHCGRREKEAACTPENLASDGYACGQTCAAPLSCGEHECSAPCHAGECGACPLAPERVDRCPCGATALSRLSSQRRAVCTDAVPTCERVCDKILRCGPPGGRPHRCKQTCHSGDCLPCDGTTPLLCRCGATTKLVPCGDLNKFDDENPLMCERRCKKQKSCKRHKCANSCCLDDEHICTQVCGKTMDCGKHDCDRLCHAGRCPPCLMASKTFSISPPRPFASAFGFDELSCRCGATWRPPPVPCGASRPPCDQSCSRAHACAHPATHRCHDENECPPCTALTRRWCYGQHELRPNIPCFLDDVSCGRACATPLACGQHACVRACHAGACLEAQQTCSQPCALPRPDCEHACGAACHVGSDCPSLPCKSAVLVSCRCGRLSKKMLCVDVRRQWARLLASRAMAPSDNASVKLLKRQDSMELYKWGRSALPSVLLTATLPREAQRAESSRRVAPPTAVLANESSSSNSSERLQPISLH